MPLLLLLLGDDRRPSTVDRQEGSRAGPLEVGAGDR